jgi:UDP-N-acetylmuramate--alanine ligase
MQSAEVQQRYATSPPGSVKAIAAPEERVYYQPTLASVSDFLTQILRPGDLALFLGAGNLNQIIPQVMDFYQRSDKDQARELSQKA